jgi:hypothetical protein
MLGIATSTQGAAPAAAAVIARYASLLAAQVPHTSLHSQHFGVLNMSLSLRAMSAVRAPPVRRCARWTGLG